MLLLSWSNKFRSIHHFSWCYCFILQSLIQMIPFSQNRFFYIFSSLTRQTTNSTIKIKRWVLVDRQFIAHPIHKYCLPSIWYHWEYHRAYKQIYAYWKLLFIVCIASISWCVNKIENEMRETKKRRKSGERKKNCEK